MALKGFLSLISALPTSKDGESSSPEALSLKQLIAINESLLNSAALNYKNSDVPPFSSATTVETITGPLLSDEGERETCNGILSSSDSESHLVLGVVQYLLRLSKSSSDHKSSLCERGLVLQSFTNITLPLLLERSHDYGMDLREAILDATFDIKSVTSDHESTSFDSLSGILSNEVLS